MDAKHAHLKPVVEGLLKNYEVAYEEVAKGHPWAFRVDLVPNVPLVVGAHPSRASIVVTVGLGFAAEGWKDLQGGLGPARTADLLAKIGLLLLTSGIEYEIQLPHRPEKALALTRHVFEDALTPQRFYDEMRCVVDAYFKCATAISQAAAAIREEDEGPKRMSATPPAARPSATVSTTGIPVDPETWKRFQQRLPTGQTSDEFVKSLLDAFEKREKGSA